jgi:hypothetical protein
MHARQLAELALLLATHVRAWLGARQPIPEAGLESYWTASKCRLDRWLRVLGASAAPRRADPPTTPHAMPLAPLVEEILASEVLTRVWTALAAAGDELCAIQHAGPLARSVYLAHQEARNRALAHLLHHYLLSPQEALVLNRLRRQCEHSTDLLLGRMSAVVPVGEFCFDPVRMRAYAARLAGDAIAFRADRAWPLVLASLRLALWFGQGSWPAHWPHRFAASPNSDLNSTIAAAVITCFPRQAFDGTGLVRSSWIAQFSHVTGESQVLVGSLFDDESACDSTPPAGRDLRRLG